MTSSTLFTRRVVPALLALIGTAAVFYAVLAWLSGDSTLPVAVVLIVTNFGLLIAHLRGWDPARYCAVAINSVVVGFGMPERYLVSELSMSTLLPAVLALVLAGPRWVVGSTVIVIGIYLLRTGERSAYSNPLALLVVAVLVGGLLLSRYLADLARRDAEQALATSEARAHSLRESERLLAEERAQLAERVSERTSELSAANSELARALHLKDEFMAMMSHELRTPLNAVLGYSEALKAGIYEPLAPGQRGALERIDASARHLLALINDILDLSKIDAGEMELRPQVLDVADVCDASLQLIWQAAEARGLEIVTSFDPAAATVYADELRLRQVLVNLLGNAVKFTPEGGSIGLDVRADQQSQTIAFVVWDTGIGIAPDDQARLFKPFVQLDTSLARRYEGTGLGLSLVARLVGLHRGSVSLQSAPGAASRFTMSLPWHGAQALEARLASASPPVSPRAAGEGAPVTVLLAEDSQVGAELVQEYLEAKDYVVVVARDGAEAVDLARTAQPAVILMDMQMPVMDGLEATRHIRADSSTAHIPIIALTALAMAGDDERCLAAGATRYLHKPVSLAELARTIEELI